MPVVLRRPCHPDQQLQAREAGAEGVMAAASDGAVTRAEGRWKVSRQPCHTNNRVAHCQQCHCAFTVGEIRLSSRGAIRHPRYSHLHCVTELLHTSDARAAAQDLGDDVAPLLEPFTDEVTPPDETAANPEGSAAATSPDDEDGHVLKHTDWWRGATFLERAFTDVEMLLTNGAQTLSDLPGPLKLAIGDAREAAAREIQGAVADEDEVASWKLFLCFDRLIFGQLLQDDGEEHLSVADRVSARLRSFWAGDWANLMQDTLGNAPKQL